MGEPVTSSGELVTLEVDAEGVARVLMQDADGRNALSPAFIEQFLSCLQRLNAARDARVAILLGLPDVFCSGGDLKTLGLMAGELPLDEVRQAGAVLDVRVPLIAAMEGHAIGGGLALGLCADILVIARESRYGCTFMNLGFTPGMGTTRLLEHAVTPALAHEMLYTGQAFKGSHFEGRGGFNYILPRDQVRPKAEELAARIAEKPAHALETLKRALSIPRRQAFEQSRTIEGFMHEISFREPGTLRMIEENYD